MSATRANVFASIPQTTRGKPVSISGDPKGDNFLYTCGTSVVIRNIHNPLIADLYDEHQRNPTCAAYAPSGFYIASGDASGTVRIWDTTQSTHPLKIELKVLGSTIYDIAWSADSQRIIVGGDGREKYGHAFIWDTGASVGEISGHSKPIYSCAIKPTRPFRVVTGSEDFVCNWYEGPPFKYKGNIKDHTRFVNCVRFSPDGNFFATVGSDKKGFVYDGKTAEKKVALDGHTGGIYSCSWSPDSSKLLTASADKTARIFDVATGQLLTTFQFGNSTDDQQLGCLWQGNYLLSVNLAGHISYLDPNNPNKPHKVIRGHNKFVTSLAYDSQHKHLFSGSYDSVITRWDLETGETVPVENPQNAHTNTIAQAVVAGGNLVTASMDDSFKVTPLQPLAYGADKFATDSPVCGVAANDQGTVVAASMHSIYLVKNGNVAATVKVDFSPKSVAISPAGDEAAFGGEDNDVHLFNITGNTFAEKGKLSAHRDHVTSLFYSPDGKYLATGCKDRSVFVFDRATGNNLTPGWVFHTSRINSVAFSPDSQHVASASLDQNVIVWDMNDKNKRITIKGAHRGGVNSVVFINNNTIASSGQDCTTKTWDLQY